jgi:threonyl-tRNA synthetase
MKEADLKDDGLYRIRHSLAHVLAQAVLVYRPHAQLAFGPPTEHGCYYDFLLETPLTPDDFPSLEKEMKRIIKEKQNFRLEEMDGEAALQFLIQSHQQFKIEYAKELLERGEEKIGFFSNGSFTDMCAGPHVEDTSCIPLDAFKIDSLAGAYWRGNSENPQLTRIYCLAFRDKSELKEHIERRALAEARDHRKLGRELELFLMNDIVGPGLPLWMPNGTAIRDELEALARETEHKCGYQRVATPVIAREELYHISGHLPYYKDGMFPPMELPGEAAYYLKAMNCPHHHLIYKHRPRSYRELPLRLSEYGTCYRYEASGALAGLLRVRSMCMNDAHIYCSAETLASELKASFSLALNYYAYFRLEGVRVRLSTHDSSNQEKYVDNPPLWQWSERVVEDVLKELEVDYFIGPGEAAFYGPKMDFQARTLLGREETISTSQLDFAQPISFDLTYIGADGASHRPFIVHRAPLGTHERFISFLIEHFGGAFPTWLAPVQVRIIPVNEIIVPYARELEDLLRNTLVRVQGDYSSNSLNKKIREAAKAKIPNVLILGNKEEESQSVTLRRHCIDAQEVLSKEHFLRRMNLLRKERIMDNFPDVVVPSE